MNDSDWLILSKLCINVFFFSNEIQSNNPIFYKLSVNPIITFLFPCFTINVRFLNDSITSLSEASCYIRGQLEQFVI